jgi:ERCC4-type nuclease
VKAIPLDTFSSANGRNVSLRAPTEESALCSIGLGACYSGDRGRQGCQPFFVADNPCGELVGGVLPGVSVYLVIDFRESDKGVTSIKLISMLQSRGVPYICAELKTGDFVWVASDRPPVFDNAANSFVKTSNPFWAHSYILGYILERKLSADLYTSLNDHRLRNQKERMLRSGLNRCMLLFERASSAIVTSRAGVIVDVKADVQGCLTAAAAVCIAQVLYVCIVSGEHVVFELLTDLDP